MSRRQTTFGRSILIRSQSFQVPTTNPAPMSGMAIQGLPEHWYTDYFPVLAYTEQQLGDIESGTNLVTSATQSIHLKLLNTLPRTRAPAVVRPGTRRLLRVLLVHHNLSLR